MHALIIEDDQNSIEVLTWLLSIQSLTSTGLQDPGQVHRVLEGLESIQLGGAAGLALRPTLEAHQTRCNARQASPTYLHLKLPCVLEVHGGPHGMYTSSVFFAMQLLAANGYVVVFSNPRGSTGYGEDFARCIDGDWGNKDWHDIQEVTKFAKSLPFVDPNRVAIMGGSYGGYMVNWAIGHSDEYKCAITDRCVSNLLSKSGNSDYTFIPNGTWPGAAYDDWEVLWDRSPVKHLKNCKTPTLVIHSEGDLRCNVEQGDQIYTFLKMQGVPTRYVRYPATTSHGMSRAGPPDLRIHRLKEILRWLEEWL